MEGIVGLILAIGALVLVWKYIQSVPLLAKLFKWLSGLLSQLLSKMFKLIIKLVKNFIRSRRP